jgi:Holliday junction resolvase RusA-like endonuclease
MKFSLTIHGKPQGKDRPRFVRATGRTYTAKETLAAEERIRDAWREVGEPVVAGPLRVNVIASTPRPQGHYLKGGELSAEGRRHERPDNQKPDLDNVAKLCLDALNGNAFKDDVAVVTLYVHRVWALRGSPGMTIIDIEEAT